MLVNLCATTMCLTTLAVSLTKLFESRRSRGTSRKRNSERRFSMFGQRGQLTRQRKLLSSDIQLNKLTLPPHSARTYDNPRPSRTIAPASHLALASGARNHRTEVDPVGIRRGGGGNKNSQTKDLRSVRPRRAHCENLPDSGKDAIMRSRDSGKLAAAKRIAWKLRQKAYRVYGDDTQLANQVAVPPWTDGIGRRTSGPLKL